MSRSGRRPDEPPRAPDLRLAGFTVALWLAALACLHLSARAGLAVTGAAAGLSAVPAVTRRRSSPRRAGGAPWRWIAVAALLGAACGGAVTTARLSVREAGPLVSLVRAGATVEADVVVRDDARPLRARPGRPPSFLVAVDLTAVRDEEDGRTLRLTARALVLGAAPAWRSVLPGQHATVTGRLLEPRGGDLRAAVLSVRDEPRLRGTSSWPQRAAGRLRAGLQRACAPLPRAPGGLLPGLVDGDTTRLDPALEADFRTSGMTHLTAVSGSNVAIVLGVVLFGVRWVRAGPWVAAAVCAVALAGFVILARPSPSVLRAAAMGAIGLVGLAIGRPRAAVPALAAGAAALLVADPELAADAGFALSVLATGGLLLLAPGWRDALCRRGWPKSAAEALVVPAAAQVACGPVVAGISGSVSIVAIPANLLVVPAIAPATLLGVAAAVLSPVWPGCAEFCAWLAHWPTWWLVLVASSGARLPAGAVPWPAGAVGGLLMGGVTVMVLIAARRRVLRRLFAAVATAALLGTLPVRLLATGWPPPGWIVVTCAVGQGDAVVLPAGDGRAVVVDAGPEPDPVDRCLRRLRIDRVIVFVVSHFHADHVGGVAGVFRGRRVDAVVAPDWPEPPAGHAAVQAEAGRGHAPVVVVRPGWSYAVGGLRLTVVGPVRPLRGTESDPNNNSLVIRAQVGERTVLLPGDAETDEQRQLLSAPGPPALRADVLKVAHHGSADQDPRFLDAVRPAVALVPVGLDNDYGHPNAAVLARLTRGGARVLRTDRDGDVAAVAVGDGVAAAARGDPPAR
ncbi:ComEC/Rec2 family competence protein [Mangrovihabitans endophyticus]|uniref:Competence protein ComEC n=1 Tax=Mangrovihabitans endophyticus TaxID=1751298 RepID=A0A8J3C6B2_9ACTN|nr:ComEC/Rec2 family competence protein [Mangrovihabitans endophyticus]GGL14788.1 competence protein ComEC [Mangrovihabitans endophyticus]